MKIEIHGPTAKIIGDFPYKLVRTATSYPVEGARFSKAFKKGVWDGRKHLLNSRSSTFPTGLVNHVRTVCEEQGYEVEIDDRSDVPEIAESGFELEGVSFTGKYAYQQEVVDAAIEAQRGIIKVATGGGKCLGIGTRVRMFDGSTKAVEDIIVGDKLLGPDSLPRVVHSTTRATGPLYKITQNMGMSYICNDVHMLTLQDTSNRTNNEIIDIPLNEYLEKGNDFKHRYKHFSVAVDYEEKDTLVDPYLFGLWVGDGRKDLDCGVSITNVDLEIINYLKNYASTNDLLCSKYSYTDRVPSWGLVTPRGQKNPLLDALREVNNSDWSEYLINSREVRLRFLAGLLDSDGSYIPDKNGYEITQKNKEYIDRIYCLVRSLGFRANQPSEKWVNGTCYYRLHFYGGDTPPPCLIPRKVSKPSSKSTRTGFTVTELGVGEYAGFTLDGDGRFLLEDYTVTHNTEIACAITKHLGLRTLFVVTSKDLMYQGRERFKKRLGLTDVEVGIVGDGKWAPGEWVTIASVDTLASKISTEECMALLEDTGLLFLDECHHAGAETVYTVGTLCNAYYRYGLSGTPLDRTDGANLRLIALTGEIISEVSNKFLVENGISAKADIIFDKVTTPILPKKLTYPSAYKQGVVENEELMAKVLEWTKIFYEEGLGVLILTEAIAQGRAIDDALWTEVDGVFIPHQYISGKEDSDTRNKALKDFGEGRLPVLVASTILDEGVDVPTIDALILAGSKKSKIRTMQRLGRGLRGDKLIVVEFANMCHKYLVKHSLQRLGDYKAEECFDIYDSSPNRELVRKLWNQK